MKSKDVCLTVWDCIWTLSWCYARKYWRDEQNKCRNVDTVSWQHSSGSVSQAKNSQNKILSVTGQLSSFRLLSHCVSILVNVWQFWSVTVTNPLCYCFLNIPKNVCTNVTQVHDINIYISCSKPSVTSIINCACILYWVNATERKPMVLHHTPANVPADLRLFTNLLSVWMEESTAILCPTLKNSIHVTSR
jgi:hypothetical protein